MNTIDFTHIRGGSKGRNQSFEALSVQLFHRTCGAPAGSTFVSLRGDGGDGGIEAYFRTPSGAVIGMQAKYFFRLGSTELGQIDDSLRTALSNHPTLSEYLVYIPFDLTGRVAKGKRGRSQAERFETWKRKVETEATERDSELTITLCTAEVIRGQLLGLDPHGGMRRYWFDESILTDLQIRNCIDQAMAFAGPRYTAALDVVTRAHNCLDFFGGIGDFQAWREESLIPVITELRSLQGWGDEALSILAQPDAAAARKLISQIIVMCEDMKEAALATAGSPAASQHLESTLPLLTRAREAQEEAFYSKYGKEKDTPGFRQFHAEYMNSFPAGEMDAARKWEEQALRLQAVLTSAEISAATTRSLLLVGPAGIGKTHAIVSAGLRRLAHGGYSLVVFGDDFGNTEPWEVIRNKLGFGEDVGRTALLECLQAFGEHSGLPFVIYIDALNESPRNARWKDKLPELIAQCKPYAGIKVCVSTRDTYRDLVVDTRFPGYAFEHAGFAGREFEAVEAFATHYGLDAEITPLFSPELSNPLVLHLMCRAIKDEGRASLDVSLSGFTALLDGHLKYCDDLVRGRLQYSNPRNLVRAAMLRLADVLTQNLPEERTWESCTNALKDLTGAEIAPDVLLRELEHEGLVILSVGEGDAWLVRLAYQRFGDVLRATSIVESVMQASGLDSAALAKKLRTLSADEEGLLEALAAVLPEKTGVEVTSSELELDPAHAHRLFISALPWRSRTSITGDVNDHVHGALHTPDLWQQVYEVFFRLSLVPEHQLNAANWLGPFLRRSSMVNRDVFLSIFAFKSFDANGAVWSLVNASLHADIRKWPVESRRLAAFALSWLTSCADRRVRGLSAKALARVVANRPDLGRELADEFCDCDDDYILESISLAIYSACLLEVDRREEFTPALEGLLSPVFDSPNVLVRDSVCLLGRLIPAAGLPDGLKERLVSFPSNVPAPRTWPTMNEAKSLLDLEDLPSNMKIWGSGIGPDFWRYQVETKLRNFDLENAAISQENIACWLMVETLKLGYPGYQEYALRADQLISHEFGPGRGRKGYAERLGKKYYWILLHRLLGLLSDNIPAKDPFSDWTPGPGHLWSVHVRKEDLTDVRDIGPLIEYPNELVRGPRYGFPDRTCDIKHWVLTDDFTQHEQCLVRNSRGGDEWVAMSMSAQDSDQSPGHDSLTDPYLRLSLYYSSILVGIEVPDPEGGRIGEDVFDGSGASCYRGYLAEYPDGRVYEQLSEEGDFFSGPKDMEFSEVTLLRGGEWEYDYSYMSQKRQGHLCVPCKSIVKILALRWDRQRGWIDPDGELAAFEANSRQRSGLFILRSSLNKYLDITKRRLVYRRFANRIFFDYRGDDSSQIDLITWLRYEPKGAPKVLKQDFRTFNCGDGPVNSDATAKFPFS